MTPHTWSSREVHYTLYPNGPGDEPERLLDALTDHYWRPGTPVRFHPGVSASNRVIEVSGLPAWLPAWWHRRVVTDVAARAGIGGTAESHVVRCALT